MEEGVTVGRVHGASRLRDKSPEEQSLERARALVLLQREKHIQNIEKGNCPLSYLLCDFTTRWNFYR